MNGYYVPVWGQGRELHVDQTQGEAAKVVISKKLITREVGIDEGRTILTESHGSTSKNETTLKEQRREEKSVQC